MTGTTIVVKTAIEIMSMTVRQKMIIEMAMAMVVMEMMEMATPMAMATMVISVMAALITATMVAMAITSAVTAMAMATETQGSQMSPLTAHIWHKVALATDKNPPLVIIVGMATMMSGMAVPVDGSGRLMTIFLGKKETTMKNSVQWMTCPQTIIFDGMTRPS